MPSKKPPPKTERAKVVAYLRRIASQDVERARLSGHEGCYDSTLQNFWLTSAQRIRDMAHQIETGMHVKRKAAPLE